MMVPTHWGGCEGKWDNATLAAQSMIQGSAASASPASSLEMQTLKPHSKSTESEPPVLQDT